MSLKKTSPWALAAGEDFRYREIEGARPAGTDLVNWYVAQVHRAATRNGAVNRAFLQVMNMLQPPTVLFKPKVVFNVIKANLAGQRATEPAPITPLHV